MPPSSAALVAERSTLQPAFELGGGRAQRRHYLFDPTCAICGISSGYQGPGGKTVVPAAAFAKIDFRLVPDQDPDDVLGLLRQHLQVQGFGDVEVVKVEGECVSSVRAVRCTRGRHGCWQRGLQQPCTRREHLD
jgi:acetylornithine deacetylase/succinyl-diaminopimelate desuccinylase-like protein